MSERPRAAVPIEALRDDIRSRRRKLAHNPGDGQPWPTAEAETSAELFYYDMALVVAATVFGLTAPAPTPGGRRRLTAPQRNHLEDRLAEHGCDVRSAPPDEPA